MLLKMGCVVCEFRARDIANQSFTMMANLISHHVMMIMILMKIDPELGLAMMIMMMLVMEMISDDGDDKC